MDFNKILIAVNSSSFSLKAAKAGFQLAHALGAEVGLLYVIDRSMENVDSESGMTRAQSELILLREAQDTMDQLIALYKGSARLYKFTPEGFPKEEILNTAKEWEADLIVMGTHAKKGLSHLISGSITDHVIRYSPVPVLIIPPGMK